MKAAEITDVLIAELASGKHRHARLNYANGDMVGHTGHRDAAILAVEAVDLCVGRLMKAIAELEGALLVTADHGNADEMYEHKGSELIRDASGALRVKTSHTLNPVPCYLYAPTAEGLRLAPRDPQPGLANIAATTLELLGFEPPEGYRPSLLGT